MRINSQITRYWQWICDRAKCSKNCETVVAECHYLDLVDPVSQDTNLSFLTMTSRLQYCARGHLKCRSVEIYTDNVIYVFECLKFKLQFYLLVTQQALNKMWFEIVQLKNCVNLDCIENNLKKQLIKQDLYYFVRNSKWWCKLICTNMSGIINELGCCPGVGAHPETGEAVVLNITFNKSLK